MTCDQIIRDSFETEYFGMCGNKMTNFKDAETTVNGEDDPLKEI